MQEGTLAKKGYNSSASQGLPGEQMRLYSGHLKVHFGAIVEGSWGGWGGGGRCAVGPPCSLTKGYMSCHMICAPCTGRDRGCCMDYRIFWSYIIMRKK